MKQGWEIKKLGECFEYIKNGANIKQERGAGGIPKLVLKHYQEEFLTEIDLVMLILKP